MQVIGDKATMRALVQKWHRAGERIAFVPTMGALHAGHVTLLRAAREQAERVVLSIFVNPTQFAANEDLAKYPRTFDADVLQAEAAGVDAIFSPSPAEIYPPHFETYVEVGATAAGLCGARRPGHFRGVATVVLKLLHIVDPDVALFGEKDYQQLQVVRRMCDDFDVRVRILGVPTVRDPDGLALSSRNVYLSPEGRQTALEISRALGAVARLFATGERHGPTLLAAAAAILGAAAGLKIDYLELCDAVSLAPINSIVTAPAVVLIAAFVDATRLIDNLQLNP